MRDEPLSVCEREFVLTALTENVRIDGRKCDDFRDLKVLVGQEFGTCLAMLGNTRVLSKVSCCLVEPRSASRGNMGTVEVHVDMSPMGSPTFEDGRLGIRGIELNHVLELLCRDCGMIDLEALCLIAHKKVWQIRIDVHVLQADGGLMDCASVSVITALAHFRRPDVSVLADAIVIHGSDQKAPIPLTVYHMPICVSFGIASNGKQIVLDPTEREEMCLKGVFVVSANKRREICALHQSGNLLLTEKLITECVDHAIQRATDITELISAVITNDNNKRSKGETVNGFCDLISLDLLTTHHSEPNELVAPSVSWSTFKMVEPEQDNITVTDGGVVHIGEPETPLFSESGEGDSELMAQVEDISAIQINQQSTTTTSEKEKETSNDAQQLLESIEEELAMLLPEGTTESLPQHSASTTQSMELDSNAPVELSAAIKRKKKKK